MTTANCVGGPAGPPDAPTLVSELHRTLTHALNYLEPARAALEPAASGGCGLDVPSDAGAPTAYDELAHAVARAHAVAKLAECIAGRLGVLSPTNMKSGGDREAILRAAVATVNLPPSARW